MSISGDGSTYMHGAREADHVGESPGGPVRYSNVFIHASQVNYVGHAS
jgi:hypothetical protein